MISRKSWALMPLILLIALTGTYTGLARGLVATTDDPLVRMPGSQPGDNLLDVAASAGCIQCHGNYNPAVEPVFNWQGSMMAQSARDFLFWPAYVAFLRDEINGTAVDPALPATAYIVQTDPFFAGLKGWGDTIWAL